MQEVKPLRGYSDEKKFYVYFHKRPDGTIFYVGKGHGNRAWVKKSRNNHWNNVVNKHGGFDVEIVSENLTEQEAFAKERELILELGMDGLTNQTLGGISTTGYRHTEETRELQRKITQQRFEDNPEWVSAIMNNIQRLNYLQKYDEEYRLKMSRIQKEAYAKLSDEEKQKAIERKTAWLKVEENRQLLSNRAKEYWADPINKEKLRQVVIESWAKLSDEERAVRTDRLKAMMLDPEIREKAILAASDKIVVNKSFVFKSKRQFLDLISSEHAPLQKAFESAHKHGFTFAIMKGFFVENFDEGIHSGIPMWNGENVKTMSIDCLPRSKGVVREDGIVFLSMHEAANTCPGKGNINAKADFITKNLKLNKPAYGFMWRIATNKEIEAEILSRLEREMNEQG